NFPLATAVPNVPTPATAGTSQTTTVSGLKAGTTYRFALVARDEEGNTSYLSNVAVVITQRTKDTTAPEAVTTLAARLPVKGGQAPEATPSAPSSEQAPDFTGAALTDGRDETMWASAARSASQTEWARIDLGELVSIDRVRVWPSAAQTALFPPAF